MLRGSIHCGCPGLHQCGRCHKDYAQHRNAAAFCQLRSDFHGQPLSKNNLYATGTTGRLIEEASNLTVHKFLAGHLGGEQQLGAMIEQNDMDLVIYLREPLEPQKHDPDVKRIFMLCDTHNIPMATNLATAEMMIRSLGRGELDWREMYR